MDTANITTNVVDGASITGGVSSGATISTTVSESSITSANVVTGARGEKGETGADSTVPGPQGPKGDQGDPTTVNGKTGASITLTPDDLDDTSTSHKFVTATDLTNLGNLSGTNTGDQPLGSRTITGTTNQISVTNGDGVSGNPTLSLPSAITTPGTMTVTDQLTVSKATSPGLIVGDGVSGYIKVGDGTLSKASGSLWSIPNVSVGAGSTAVVALSFGGLNTGLFGSTTTVKASISGTERLSLDATTLSSTVHVAPSADSTYTNGSSTNYWSNTYTDRLYLNSTAYIDGGTAGSIVSTVSGDLKVASSTSYKGIFVNGNAAPNIGFARSTTATSEWKAGISGNNGAWFSISSGTSNSDRLIIDASGNVGLGSTTLAPTHTLSLASTSTGIALYNTADQTTNYERAIIGYSSNVFEIRSSKAGTGSSRTIAINSSGAIDLTANNTSGSGTTNFIMRRNAVPLLDFSNTVAIGATGDAVRYVILAGASSGTQNIFTIAPTLTQSSTAGYTALLINPTQTSVGSGTKLLTDWQVGGVSQAKIQSDGVFFPKQAPTASAPTYVKGGIYFDTTLNKLRVGGATGWETITSA